MVTAALRPGARACSRLRQALP